MIAWRSVDIKGGVYLVGFFDYVPVGAWLKRGLDRPTVQRGLEIPKRA